MHFCTLVAVVAAAAVTTVTAQCSQPYVRREWNELSSGEKAQYAAAAAAAVGEGKLTGTIGGSMSAYDLVEFHTLGAQVAHGVAQFYPFHRAMLYLYEQVLAQHGWTGGIVYWDWSAVAGSWWNSDVFQYFGEANAQNSDYCVSSGPFGKGKYKVSPYPGPNTNPARVYVGNDQTCLKRCAYVGGALDSPEAIANTNLVGGDYVAFHADDSHGYHANGHIVIGGTDPPGSNSYCDMGNFFFSPNDPIFYLHHAFLDKTWWKWQNLCPQYRDGSSYSFGGNMNISPADPSGVASVQEVLDEWDSFSVGNMLDTAGGNPLCYTYSQSAGDITNFAAPNCPDGKPANKNWPFNTMRPIGGNGGGTTTTTTTTGTDGSTTVVTTTTTSTGTQTSGTSSSASAVSTDRAAMEAKWFADQITQLLVLKTSVSSGNGTFGPGGSFMQRRDDVAPVTHDWKLDVTYTTDNVTGTQTVCWGADACVDLPEGYTPYKILQNYVTVVNSTCLFTTSNGDFTQFVNHEVASQAPDMPVKKLFKPGFKEAKIEAYDYTPTNACVKEDKTQCVKYPRFLTELECKDRMMDWDLYQVYMNKVYKIVDEINADPNYVSPAYPGSGK